jgi:hypothetical protein
MHAMVIPSPSFLCSGVDTKKRTRLHVAVTEGHVGVAMALIGSGCKVLI